MNLRALALAGTLLLILGGQALAQSRDAENRQDATPDVVDQTLDEDDELLMRSDRPIVVRVPDLENQGKQIEVDVLITRDRDGAPLKIRFPVLFRIDTGPDTEFRVFSDFFTIQDPTRGFGDISLGMKWQCGPRTSLVAAVEVPTGSAGFGDPGAEPSLLLSQEFPLSKRWEFILNASVALQRDAATLDYYTEFDSAAQFGYHLDSDTLLSAALLFKSPDSLQGGITRLSGAVGLSRDLDDDNRINLTVGRSFSSSGDDYLVLFGWNHKL